MTSTKVLTFCFFFASVFLFHACKEKQQPLSDSCGINGTIDVGSSAWSHANGFMISLTNTTDESVVYKAVSDANGKFQFRNLEAGEYSVDAVKEGYRWVWMTDDGEVNPRNRLIELRDNKIKELSIYMTGNNGGLDITDSEGQTLTRIAIPRNASTVSFRLYNGTQVSHTWELQYDRCYAFSTWEQERVFLTFNADKGTLKPGDNIVLIGTVNPEIFSDRFDYISGVVYLSDYSSINDMFNSYDVYIKN